MLGENFEKYIPRGMRYKAYEVVDDTLYWVTQEPFDQFDLAHFVDALEDFLPYKKALVICRDDSRYSFKKDLASGKGQFIDLDKEKIKESLPSQNHVSYVLDNVLNWDRGWDFDKRSLKQIAKACENYDDNYSAKDYYRVIKDRNLLDKKTKNSIYRTREANMKESEDKFRVIPLDDAATAEAIESVLGQMSDGYWENSSSYDKYWRFADVESSTENNTGTLEILDKAGTYGNCITYNGRMGTRWIPNGFYGKSDEEIKKFFARKIKYLVKEEGLDWSRDNQEISAWFGYKITFTAAMLYTVYDKLMGRVDKKLDEAKKHNISLREAVDRDKQFLLEHKEELDHFIGHETKIEVHPIRGPYLYASGYWNHTNYGYHANMENGKVRVQVVEYHPYDDADYAWALCFDFVNKPEKWNIVLAGKIIDKVDVSAKQDLLAILKDKNSNVKPRMMYENLDNLDITDPQAKQDLADFAAKAAEDAKKVAAEAEELRQYTRDVNGPKKYNVGKRPFRTAQEADLYQKSLKREARRTSSEKFEEKVLRSF